MVPSTSAAASTATSRVASAQAVPRATSGPTGKLAIRISEILPGAAPIPGPTPLFALSRSSRWVRVSLNGKPVGFPIGLGYAADGCAGPTGSPTDPIRCTIVVDAPAGRGQTLKVTTSIREAGPPLAQATQTVDVVAGTTKKVAPTFYGVARRLVVRASTLHFYEGSPAIAVVSVYGLDDSGAFIPSQRVIDPSGEPLAGIVLSATGPYPIERMSFNGKNYPPFAGFPFSSVIFNYDGRRSGTETITATSPNGEFPPATAVLTIRPVPTGPAAEIFAATKPVNATSSEDSVVEFAPGASGNAGPLRRIGFGAHQADVPFATDGHGGFWADDGMARVYHYDGFGRIIGSVSPDFAGEYVGPAALDSNQNLYAAIFYESGGESDCSGQNGEVRQYAPGFGEGRILGTTPLDWRCVVSYLASDGLGDLYVGETQENPVAAAGTIVEYGPPGGRGERHIVRVIPQTANIYFGTVSTMAPFAADANGNLFEVNAYPSGSTGLLEYPAGSTTPRTILAGIPISAFALDRRGDIFAEVPVSSTAFSIEEFAPGSSTPMRTISGPATGLEIPAGITVTP